MLEWEDIIPLTNEEHIMKTEKNFDFVYPLSYIEVVKKCNGGYPPIDKYDTDTTKGRTIKALLSLNTSDIENVYNAFDNAITVNKDVVPFAGDDFGNYICFNKPDGKIVFLDFESEELEGITDTFDDFIKIIDPTWK